MRESLSSVDAAWYHLDRPDNPADVVALLTFREAPAMPELRRLVEERLLSADRFRQRVVPGKMLRGVAWEEDPGFSLDRHLVARTVAAGKRALEDLVGEVASEVLDPAHPPWRLVLVNGPGQAAIVARLHHAIADGFALVSLLLSLADERPDVPAPRHALAAYRRMEPWLAEGGLLRALGHPVSAAKLVLQAAGLTTSLLRMASYRADPHTSLQRGLSGARRMAWSRGFPLAAVRRGAQAAGATVNDLLIAALAGGLRAELAGSDAPRRGLRVRALVPINLRPGPPEPSARALGNRFGLVFLELPLDAPTRTARVERVRAAMTLLKGRPDALAAFGALSAAGRVPPLTRPLITFFTRKASLVVTNVPGPKKRLHLAGREIEHAMFWVPHPATLGLGVSILTYAGEVRVGVRADTGVLPDPSSLVRRFEEELAALAPQHEPIEG